MYLILSVLRNYKNLAINSRRLYKSCDKKSDDISYLNHWVDSRPRGVFVWVAYRIASYCGLVSIGSFATIVTLLNKFLSIVPGGSTRSHRYSDEQSSYNYSD